MCWLKKFIKDVLWINIARQVDLEKIEQTRKLKLPGFGYANESKRIAHRMRWQRLWKALLSTERGN